MADEKSRGRRRKLLKIAQKGARKEGKITEDYLKAFPTVAGVKKFYGDMARSADPREQVKGMIRPFKTAHRIWKDQKAAKAAKAKREKK